MSGENLRILIADDHPIVLAGLSALVRSEPDLTVVGEAKDGAAALAMALEACPDVMVLDVSMPGMGGAEVVEALLAEQPACRILILTVHDDRATLRRMLDLGVAGYLVKRSATEELIRAIRAVAAGGVWLDPAIAAKAIGLADPGGSAVGAGATAELSERETEVMKLVATGHSNKEISTRLEISIKTVETYKARAMEKLGLRSRVDVVRHAASQGWLPGS